jgi:DNA-binding beta-propeller fold protein YncE
MNDFEPKVRAALSRAAQGAPSPAVFERSLARRARARFAVMAAAAVVALASVVTGSVVLGGRLVSTPDPAPASNDHEIGPWTSSLYVLDPHNLGEQSMVYAVAETDEVDLDGQVTVTGSYPAGYDPQITLSPDGSRLFVVSSLMPSGVESYRNVIDTYDTRTEERIARATLPELDGVNVNRTLHKGPVLTPDFVASADGSRLYIGESTQRRGPVRARMLIGTFDTATNSLQANSFEITDCNIRVLLPGLEPNELTVVCSATTNHRTVPATNFVYFLEVADDGSLIDSRRLDLPPTGTGRGDIAWAQASADGTVIYAVTQDGHVFELDVAHQDVADQEDLGTWANETVQMQKVLLSPDGDTLYVGTTGSGSSSVVNANGIRAFDTTSWEPVGSVTTDDFYWTLALGPGGERLYAPTFGEPTWSIQVFDADTLEQLRTIEDVGDTPALIEVPRLGR